MDSLPYILLPLTCLWFDEALKISVIRKNDHLRAVTDSGAHGTIACLSWLAVVGLGNIRKKRRLLEVFLCGLMSCTLDIDHFILATSFRLKDAMSLGGQRPALHSTTLLIPILLCATILSHYYPSLWRLPLIVTVAVVSHHFRDGQRRGLWFWPIGSSPAIPYWLYLVIITTLPLLISFIIRTFKHKTTVTLTNV